MINYNKTPNYQLPATHYQTNSKLPTTNYQLPVNGFTIMEIIVVIFVISISLTGIVSLITQNIQVGYVNKNMIMASQLAQEGFELVRNLRDNNWKAESNWKTGIIGDGTYAISLDSSGPVLDISVVDVDSINDVGAKLFFDNNGFYVNSSSGSPSLFSRMIEVKSEQDNYIVLECIVQWRDRSSIRQYSVQTMLYDWR